MKIVYRFFHRFQEFVQLVSLNFDSKHGSDPYKSTPRIKYFGKNSSVNAPLKICISHDLRKIQYFHAYICFHVPHIYLISNGMLTFQSTPKKLLNQTKETILITALEKIYIIGENSKWIFWEAKGRFCIFGKKNRPSKIKQRVCNLIFHIL